MNLDIIFEKYELYYDELDSNTIHFITKDGYFFISSIVYLEEDNLQLNEVYFEINNQCNSQYGGLKSILFEDCKINIVFLENEMFVGKYSTITINFNCVDQKIVDFFSNFLFLGKYISFENNFNKDNIVFQTEERDYL